MKGTGEEPGIIPLAVREVFQLISECTDREFLLRVSYMEVGGWVGGWVGGRQWQAGMLRGGWVGCSGRVGGGGRVSVGWQLQGGCAKGDAVKWVGAAMRNCISTAGLGWLQDVTCYHLPSSSAAPPLFRCSLQLYNEDINDLLAPENQKLQVCGWAGLRWAGWASRLRLCTKLLLNMRPTGCLASSSPWPALTTRCCTCTLSPCQVHETKEAGVYVAGLREDIVSCPEQVWGQVVRGKHMSVVVRTGSRSGGVPL